MSPGVIKSPEPILSRPGGSDSGEVNVTRTRVQRVADGVKVLLDVMKESFDWLPSLKSVVGGVNALVKYYEVWIERVTVTHNLHEHPQQFEDVRKEVEYLKPQLDGLKQNTINAHGGVIEEIRRRAKLAKYLR